MLINISTSRLLIQIENAVSGKKGHIQYQQYLQMQEGILQPAAKKKSIPDSPNDGVILYVNEINEAPPRRLKEFVAAPGEAYCFLNFINHRPLESP